MSDVMQKGAMSAVDHRGVRKKIAVVEQMPLTERSVQVVEAGLAEYQRIREESTRLAEELRRAENQLHLFEVEMKLRDQEIVSLRARCAELERIIDGKTGDYAVLETMLHNVKVQLDAFLPARNEQAPPPASLVPWDAADESQAQAGFRSEERIKRGVSSTPGG